jgi:hypothetical protein
MSTRFASDQWLLDHGLLEDVVRTRRPSLYHSSPDRFIVISAVVIIIISAVVIVISAVVIPRTWGRNPF